MLHKIRTEIGSRNSTKWATLLVLLVVSMSAWAEKKTNSAPPQQQQRSTPPPSRPASPPPQQRQQPQQRQSASPPQHPAYQQPPQQRQSTSQQRSTYPANNNGAGGTNMQRPTSPNQGYNRNAGGANTSRPGTPNTNHNPNTGTAAAHPGDRNAGSGPNPGDQRNRAVGDNRNDNHLREPGRVGDRNPRDMHGSREAHSYAPPRRETRDVGTRHVSFDDHHRAREIHSRDGLDIHRGLRPHDRVVERHFSGGRRVVSMGPHRGFSERAYINHGGHAYVQRTYVYGGRRYAYAYRTAYWGGRPYYRYAPGYYYHPGFYGWAYNPWPAPVYYGWGWGPSPWYGYYGYYFAPEPVYPTASLWLTDFLLAENLKAAYDAQQEENTDAGAATAPASQSVRLSPEVKREIASEVQAELQAERTAAAQAGSTAPLPASNSNDERPPVLDPSTRVFVVSNNLAVGTDDGQECELTAGDVLSRIDDTPGDDNTVQVLVTGSKKADCGTGSKPRVQVADLQEMHNHFREQLDAGLQTLAAGGKGLPKAPDTGTSAGEVPPPQPDDAEAQVQQLQKDGDQTEREVSQQAGGQGGHQ